MLKYALRALDVAASLVIVVAGVLVIHRAYAERSTAVAGQDSSATVITKGMGIAAPRGTDFAKQDVTFIVYVKSSCRFCVESMPFYGQLATAAKASSGKIRLVFASSEPVGVTAQSLHQHGVEVPSGSAVQVDRGDYPFVAGTPTLLAVDSAGRLMEAWRGRLDPEGESRVLQLVTGANSSTP